VPRDQFGQFIIDTNTTIQTSVEAVTKAYQDLQTQQQETIKNLTETGSIKQALEALKEQARDIIPPAEEFKQETNETKMLVEQVKKDMLQIEQSLRSAAQIQIPLRKTFGQLPVNSGVRGFALGGSVDAVPAMLREGEFVMSRQAHRQFAPILQAMNSSSNNSSISFGDINISVPPGSAKDQVEYIASALQRRVRLGLLKFN
jgi:hypothetical protein